MLTERRRPRKTNREKPGRNTSGLKRGGPGRKKGVSERGDARRQGVSRGPSRRPGVRAKGKPKDVVELQRALYLVDEHAADEELKARLDVLMAKAGGTVLWTKP
jgi:hypothetical protein